MPSENSSTQTRMSTFTVGNIERNSVSLISENFETVQIPLSLLGYEADIGDCIRVEFVRDFSQERARRLDFEKLITELASKYAHLANTENRAVTDILKVAHNFALLQLSCPIDNQLHVFVNGNQVRWLAIQPDRIKITGLLPGTRYDIRIEQDGKIIGELAIQTPNETDLSCILLFVQGNSQRHSELIQALGIKTTDVCNEFVTHGLASDNFQDNLQTFEALHIPIETADWLHTLQLPNNGN